MLLHKSLDHTITYKHLQGHIGMASVLGSVGLQFKPRWRLKIYRIINDVPSLRFKKFILLFVAKKIFLKKVFYEKRVWGQWRHNSKKGKSFFNLQGDDDQPSLNSFEEKTKEALSRGKKNSLEF